MTFIHVIDEDGIRVKENGYPLEQKSKNLK